MESISTLNNHNSRVYTMIIHQQHIYVDEERVSRERPLKSDLFFGRTFMIYHLPIVNAP